MGKSNLAKKGLVILTIVLFSFLLLEFSARLLIPSNKWRFHDAREDWQPDPEIGWVQRGEIQDPYYKTNPDGLVPETAKREKDPSRKRVLIFGDSTVVGRILFPEETLRVQLEKRLKEKSIDAEVISAGVEGYATTQAYLLMKRLVPLYHPDLILHAVCQNDFSGNKVAFEHGLKKPIANLEGKQDLKWQWPGTQEIDLGNRGARGLLRSSVVATIIGRAIAGYKNRESLGKGINSEADFYSNPEALKSLDWDLFKRLIAQMDQIAKENQSKFVFFLTPSTEEVWEASIQQVINSRKLDPSKYDRYAVEKKMREIASSLHINFIPQIDAFLKEKEKGPFHLIPYDRHPNASGYAVEAKVLAEQLNLIY